MRISISQNVHKISSWLRCFARHARKIFNKDSDQDYSHHLFFMSCNLLRIAIIISNLCRILRLRIFAHGARWRYGDIPVSNSPITKIRIQRKVEVWRPTTRIGSFDPNLLVSILLVYSILIDHAYSIKTSNSSLVIWPISLIVGNIISQTM